MGNKNTIYAPMIGLAEILDLAMNPSASVALSARSAFSRNNELEDFLTRGIQKDLHASPDLK